MGAIGKLISTKIENYVMAIVQKKLIENKDGSFFSPAGDDSPPLPDDKIFMSSVDGSGKFAFLGTLMITQGAEHGEKILYSRDSSGGVKGKLYINKSGEFVFNDGTDYAVAFEDLKTAMDNFKTSIESSITSAIASAIVGHTHISNGAGVATNPGIGAGAVPPVVVNIDLSKVEKVRLP